MQLRKRWIIAIIAIVLVVAVYLVFNFVRGISYYNRGIAHYAKGEYDQAIFDYTKVLEINPGDAQAYNNLGAIYCDVKVEYDRAISEFNKAIEINPRFANAYYNRAVAYYHKGEYDKSWEDVHKAEFWGPRIHPGFLKLLREASGRER